MFGKRKAYAVCYSCGAEDPDAYSSYLPNGQSVYNQLSDMQKADDENYVVCDECTKAFKRNKRPEGQWKCSYCVLLNNGDKVFCEKCHASRE